MTLKPWQTYTLIAALGVVFSMTVSAIVISIAWPDLDFQEQTGSAPFEQVAPDPAEQITPDPVEQLTLGPTVHASAGETPEPTPGGTPTPWHGRSGFRPTVRYEALLPIDNNQAFSKARKERHSKSGELISELLVQLDTLDLQTQFHDVQLNTEGNFRKGGYLKFVFDDTEGQDEAIRNMIRKLRHSAPSGFIHLRAYETSHRDY